MSLLCAQQQPIHSQDVFLDMVDETAHSQPLQLYADWLLLISARTVPRRYPFHPTHGLEGGIMLILMWFPAKLRQAYCCAFLASPSSSMGLAWRQLGRGDDCVTL